jgi:hypothetical protein
VGTEMLVDGGFEIDLIAPFKQPDAWKVQLQSKDKMKCNTVTTIVAFEGDCAYAFKGSATEVTKLSQKPDLALHTVGAGDTLTLTLQYKTGASAPKLKFKVIVLYTDITVTPDRRKGTIADVSSTAYSEFAPLPLIVSNNGVSVVKVQFQNRALTGKIFIDKVSLIHTENTARFR